MIDIGFGKVIIAVIRFVDTILDGRDFDDMVLRSDQSSRFKAVNDKRPDSKVFWISGYSVLLFHC